MCSERLDRWRIARVKRYSRRPSAHVSGDLVMTQANRPTVSAEAVENLTRKLAGRDPFDIMEEQLPALRAVTATLSDDDLRKREAPGKWSVLEVVQHLADTELAYG